MIVYYLVKRKGKGRVSSSVQTASRAFCRTRLVHYTRLSSSRNLSVTHQGGVNKAVYSLCTTFPSVC